jgi:GNAT superfamily N-acetyltransferase
MAVQVLPAEDADMHRIFSIAALAFDRNEPFWDLMYPNHWTEEGKRAGGERMLKTKHEDPNTIFLKAVGPETGEIMGMAKWNVYDNVMPDMSEITDAGDHWESKDDREYATAMVNAFLKDRNEAVKAGQGNLVSLDILAIDPAYQRRGVGSALVKWGTDKADEMGVDAVVESSVFGKGLYQKNGFVFIKDVEIPRPEKWREFAPSRYAWLIRPAVRPERRRLEKLMQEGRQG